MTQTNNLTTQPIQPSALGKRMLIGGGDRFTRDLGFFAWCKSS